jgi:hypothetical protein
MKVCLGKRLSHEHLCEHPRWHFYIDYRLLFILSILFMPSKYFLYTILHAFVFSFYTPLRGVCSRCGAPALHSSSWLGSSHVSLGLSSRCPTSGLSAAPSPGGRTDGCGSDSNVVMSSPLVVASGIASFPRSARADRRLFQLREPEDGVGCLPLLRTLGWKVFGKSWTRRLRMAGRQAQIIATASSISVQMTTST